MHVQCMGCDPLCLLVGVPACVREMCHTPRVCYGRTKRYQDLPRDCISTAVTTHCLCFHACFRGWVHACTGGAAAADALPDSLDDVFVTLPTPPTGNVNGSAQESNGPLGQVNGPCQETNGPCVTPAGRAAAAADGPPPAVACGWLLFNDFAVSGPVPAAQVVSTYGGQKLPAMVYYERVRAI